MPQPIAAWSLRTRPIEAGGGSESSGGSGRGRRTASPCPRTRASKRGSGRTHTNSRRPGPHHVDPPRKIRPHTTAGARGAPAISAVGGKQPRRRVARGRRSDHARMPDVSGDDGCGPRPTEHRQGDVLAPARHPTSKPERPGQRGTRRITVGTQGGQAWETAPPRDSSHEPACHKR